MNDKVFTVGEITKYIKNSFESNPVFKDITISGEISNYKISSNRHAYFTLKDNMAEISAVIFQSNISYLKFAPQNGMKVEARGRITVYEQGGRYQIVISSMQQAGLGKLHEEYLRLVEELKALGMFDEGYKKPIPKYAEKVGIVTAQSGAAIRDMVSLINQKNPFTEVFLCPSQVQGNGAAQSIANAIGILDKLNLDVIIIGRGGGSIEDLWAFNERIVADAIFKCNTPVISGVGHETDNSISDFVADLRERTPSSAAASAVFDLRKTLEYISNSALHMTKMLNDKINAHLREINIKQDKLKLLSPINKVENNIQFIDACTDKLNSSMLNKISLFKNASIQQRANLNLLINKKLDTFKHKIELRENSFKHLSPYEKISKGYSYVSKADGLSIKSVNDVKIKDLLHIAVTDGIIEAEVVKCRKHS